MKDAAMKLVVLVLTLTLLASCGVPFVPLI
jgi:hypothetical protein